MGADRGLARFRLKVVAAVSARKVFHGSMGTHYRCFKAKFLLRRRLGGGGEELIRPPSFLKGGKEGGRGNLRGRCLEN